ncbi:MAG: YggT family protein [Paracoccaceae bacterium]
MVTLYQTLGMIVGVAQFIVILHVILSWLISFQVLNMRQPLVSQFWYGLTGLLEPVYSRVRRFLPNTGAIDLAPLVVLLAIFILSNALRNNADFFY